MGVIIRGFHIIHLKVYCYCGMMVMRTVPRALKPWEYAKRFDKFVCYIML